MATKGNGANGRWKAILAAVTLAGALTGIVGNAYGDLSARLDGAQGELAGVREELAVTSGVAANLRVENAHLRGENNQLRAALRRDGYRTHEVSGGTGGGSDSIIVIPPSPGPRPSRGGNQVGPKPGPKPGPPAPPPPPEPKPEPTCLPAIGICIG
ncbi:MAG: hypothetical protein ACRDHM_07375 [Actinomycetota bacterium]